MDNNPAQENVVVKKPAKFFLIVILVLIISGILGYLYYSFKDNISNFMKGKDKNNTVNRGTGIDTSAFNDLLPQKSRIIEDDTLVKRAKMGYSERVGLPLSEEGFIDYYYVKIISSGDVNTKDFTLEDGSAGRLFLLKGTLENGSSVEAVVGISYLKEEDVPFNWWPFRLIEKRYVDEGDTLENITQLNSLDEQSLESLFKESSSWRYYFYFDNRANISSLYRSVLENVYAGKNPSDVLLDLKEKGSTDVILMPY